MPRMDPIKLLNCLSVVLLPNGGIKSTDEVERLAKLMTQYSKKLVSKCIYIQILKCTETNLLDIFMGYGGWRLVHMWLTEGIAAKNWPLVKELLELLLLCPVDIDRLKSNNCPKLVKELSKDENHYAIRAFASKLVEQWLKTVKGEQSQPVSMSDIPKIVSDTYTEVKSEETSGLTIETMNSNDKNFAIVQTTKELDVQDNSNSSIDEKKYNDINAESVTNVPDKKDGFKNESELLPVLKITLKNGKQILTQVDGESKSSVNSEDKTEVKNKSKSKDKSNEKRSSNSSKSRSSKNLSKSKSSIDRHHSHKDSSNKHNSSSSKSKKSDSNRHSSLSNSSKSKSSSSNSSKKASSSSSKSKEDRNSQKSSSDKEKNKEKEKPSADKEQTNLDSEVKPQIPSIHKLGRIPKLSDVKREKPSISIEVRKPEDPKPKTVKTFHSKFRKHGLEEEIHPPPSRASVLTKKPLPPLPPTVSIPKRPSPVHNESPPEKKPKTIDIVDKPGAIKLIPPKPKPVVLQESDLFMDALNASATNKKEPKKKKKRTSGSKDGTSNDGSPPHAPTNIENKSVPPKFYQDTLDGEESKKKSLEKEVEINENVEKITNIDNAEEKMDVSEPHTRIVNGIQGVLCYHKRKGPKKSIRWKPDTELEEIQYFELDETERVNVTKTFTDMKHLERINEREAFQKARNLTNDDIMEEKTSWRPLIFVDSGDQVQVEYGKNSKEKDIQAIRQKGTLQPLYFHKAMIPDSPFEPDLETHTYSEPTIIPLDDVTGNVSDFRNMPWPEPKGNPPPTTSNNITLPPFPPNISQFQGHFPPVQFPASGFQGPPILSGEWLNNVPPTVMSNGLPVTMIPPVMPPSSSAPGSMPPRLMAPPDNIMMGPNIFGGPNPMFLGHPDGFNMPPNIFPDDFTMPSGPLGPPVPDSFTGPGNYRVTMRGRTANEHWRGKANGNFDGPPRGRGGSRGRKAVCIHFQRKGSCRQGDSCSFLHPGVNCPY